MDAMTQAIDVTDETFEQVVIEGSKTTPVVVDLWAAWCGPCRTLGPMLEKVATERDGAFTLAKIDVDAQQVGNALLQAVQSQSIPTVIAFRDGQPVSMFIGAYPETELNRFVDSILPSEAEREAEAAAEVLEAGETAEAEAGFRDALAKEPGNREAGLGLARILLSRGAFDEARPLRDAAPAGPGGRAPPRPARGGRMGRRTRRRAPWARRSVRPPRATGPRRSTA